MLAALHGHPRSKAWLRQAGWLLTAVCWSMAIAWGCLQEAGNASNDWWNLPLPHKDKLAHAGMHALLAWLLWRGCAACGLAQRSSLACATGIVAWCAIYGMAIEWAQWQFTLTRSAEALDALANTLGAMIAVTLARKTRHSRG